MDKVSLSKVGLMSSWTDPQQWVAHFDIKIDNTLRKGQ